MSTELTTAEQDNLADCESKIEKGLKHFIAVGTALMLIQESQLYRETDDSFSAYCLRRWKISRGYAYRLIAACEVAKDVLPCGDIAPTNEAQCRPLASLEPEERSIAWAEAVETAPVDDEGEPIVTGAHVAATVAKRKAEPVAAEAIDEDESEDEDEPKEVEQVAEPVGVFQKLRRVFDEMTPLQRVTAGVMWRNWCDAE